MKELMSNIISRAFSLSLDRHGCSTLINDNESGWHFTDLFALYLENQVEILGAVVNVVACSVNAKTIVDVGSGQGYLAQALSFIYQQSVIAIDASLHHSTDTATRAERIKKYYAAKLCKEGQGSLHLMVPQVVTSRVLSSDSLIDLCTSPYNQEDSSENSEFGFESPSLVLAGLHACGELSVSMLRFLL